MELAHNTPVSAVFAVNRNQHISFSSAGETAMSGIFYDSSAGQRERWRGNPCHLFLTRLKTICSKEMFKGEKRKEHRQTVEVFQLSWDKKIIEVEAYYSVIHLQVCY